MTLERLYMTAGPRLPALMYGARLNRSGNAMWCEILPPNRCRKENRFSCTHNTLGACGNAHTSQRSVEKCHNQKKRKGKLKNRYIHTHAATPPRPPFSPYKHTLRIVSCRRARVFLWHLSHFHLLAPSSTSGAVKCCNTASRDCGRLCSSTDRSRNGSRRSDS